MTGRLRPPCGADLHVHSNASDGTDTPGRVVERAAELGLAAFALTDHDTVAGLDEAMEAGRRFGIEVVAGIELSAEHDGREVHLLAWFFRPDDERLVAALERLLEARRTRIDRMIGKLNGLGIPLTGDDVRARAAGRSIGRPHVADALVYGGYVASDEEAWADYLGPDGKAYVERERLPLGDAIALVRAAGGISAVAHPTLNLDLGTIAEVAEMGVAALEARHPQVSEDDSAALVEICRRRGLIDSAGSDCHGSRRGGPTLGRFTVTTERLEDLRRLARGRPPMGGRAGRAG